MIRLLAGDCRDVLATLPADSVQCVVTSPPYYGLRDYGTAQWDGGDATCDHAQKRSMGATTLRLDGREHLGAYDGEKATQIGTPYRATCGKCGAVRVDRQIGLEPTPDEYLATMVAVFREVRRVLRRDGTCWVNMGDSYCSGTNAPRKPTTTEGADVPASWATRSQPERTTGGGLAAKQLLMMPARLAIALQQDGWWVRSDIIWHKPNPMPESVTDRPTGAHEHVFLLTKSARYYYDADAVREDAEYGRSLETASWHAKADANSAGIRFKSTTTPGSGGSRNLRNVWTIATAPYSEAHFATFPPALAERCIKAGTSERGCCGQCGKPWVREARPGLGLGAYNDHSMDAVAGMGAPSPNKLSGAQLAAARAAQPAVTTGWRAGCDHEAPVSPCVVLDPFAGAGTTLLVADRLQRDAIGIELNPAYTEMAMERCRADAPLFVDVPPAADPEDERMADLFAEAAE